MLVRLFYRQKKHVANLIMYNPEPMTILALPALVKHYQLCSAIFASASALDNLLKASKRDDKVPKV